MADDEDEHDDGEVGGHVQAPAHAVVHHDLAAAPDQSELSTSASKSSIRRFVITEKAPTRAFSWLKAATTAFTFKTLC